jgi:DNA-binding MarR family transcriptional regulator
MKEHEALQREIALMLERQDMLSKLTENQCLDEYGYSETHCIDYIGKLERPNVTKIAEQMGMTRGAISKMTKKLLAKGLIEKYTLETNKKEIYYRLTDQGKVLFDEHAKRHRKWEKRDREFLSRYSKEQTEILLQFMKEFNHYLDEQIERETAVTLSGK